MLSSLTSTLPAHELTPAAARLLADTATQRRDEEALLALVSSLVNNKTRKADPGVCLELWSSPLLMERFVATASGAPPYRGLPALELTSSLQSVAAAVSVLERLPGFCAEESELLNASTLVLYHLSNDKDVEPTCSEEGAKVLEVAARRLLGNVSFFVSQALPVLRKQHVAGLAAHAGGGLELWAPVLRDLPRSPEGAIMARHVWDGFEKASEVLDLLPVLPFPKDLGKSWELSGLAGAILDRLASLLPSLEVREVFDRLAPEWDGTLGELCDFARSTCES